MDIILDGGAFIPQQAYPGWDAGFDLRTPIDFYIPANKHFTIDTGVHIDIPQGYFGKVESKSGLNAKNGIVCCGGLIDAGYTGPIRVTLYNLSNKKYCFVRGDKIAQIIFQKHETCIFKTVESFKAKGQRGDNGFGSSGR